MAEETRSAVALRYDASKGDAAPRVIAKGSGPLADEILRLGQKHGIPLRQDPALAGALAQLELDAAIPPELFRAVAELLAFIYKMNDTASKIKR